MKTNKKLHSIALSSTVLVLFLIVLSSTASASITETRITNHGTADNCTIGNINGNKIVCADERNGVSDIYMYDLSTKKETQITTSGNAHNPYIYGNRIVWDKSWDNGLGESSDIYMYDITTKKTTRITNNGVAWAPVIYGNTILWDDGRQLGNIEADSFYMYDLSTHKETLITTALYPSSPSIYGNKIVWSSTWGDYGEDLLRSDVYMYDISTHKKTYITKNGYASNPNIYGNKIVWQDWRNGNIDKQDIYVYDIATKKQNPITNHGTSSNPTIYNDNIVWQDSRNGNWDIYAYDLKTHQQTHTTDKLDWIVSAISIYGNKVAWTDYRDGKSDVYMGTISYLPVAAFTASPTSGKHPLTVKFTDKSTDVYSYNWNFGDKSTSTAKNPTHKYTKAGKYTVKLTVKNAAGSSSKTMVITVK